MTDDELAEFVTHEVVGNYGGPDSEPPSQHGCLWLVLGAAFFAAVLAILAIIG